MLIGFCPQEIFENVNKAYEFLCSKKARSVDGPDPDNIVLILKSQSILFRRYKEGEYTVQSLLLPPTKV